MKQHVETILESSFFFFLENDRKLWFYTAQFFYFFWGKDWQILGLDLVLVTLHGQFTLSNDQYK